jgi:predicted nucleic acid-binding protein
VTYVFDASPLVVLATAEHLDLLGTFERCLTTERVREEVVDAGRDAGYADANRIARAIEDGRLDVWAVEGDHFETVAAVDGLSTADASVLALAAEVDGTAVVDEAIGRDVADAEGIDARGTAYLVLSLVRDGTLTTAEGRDIVDDMVAAGWYCSTDLYRRIQRMLNDFDDE